MLDNDCEDIPDEANACCEEDDDNLTSDDDIAALCLFSIEEENVFFSMELEAEAIIDVDEDS